MRHWWLLGAVVLGSGAAWAGEGVPPGFVQTDYASVCDVARIAIAPDGVIYAGNSGCGGGPGDPAWVWRVGLGGSPVEEYGEFQIPDPDAVAFDPDGSVSGTPGSVLVGSTEGGEGHVRAIFPDETIVDLFGPVSGPQNPTQMVWDPSGRALTIDFPDSAVYEITADGPSLLIEGPGKGVRTGVVVGPDGHIYIARSDGAIEVYDAAGELLDDAFYVHPVGLGSTLAFGPGNEFGDALYALSVEGELLAIDADGNAEVFATGFEGGNRAFGPDGAMYATVGGEKIVRIAPCMADCNGDEMLSVLDFVCFQGEWASQSPFGDCDGNGQYNVLDFVCYQGMFVECLP